MNTEMTIVKLRQKARNHVITVQEYLGLVAQWVEYSIWAKKCVMSLDRGKYASIMLCTHIVPTFWMRHKSNNPSQVTQRCRLTLCNGIQMPSTCCSRGDKASYLIMPMTFLVYMFCMLSFTMHIQYVLMPRMNLSSPFSLIVFCMKMILMIYMKIIEMTIVKLRQKAQNYGINVQEYLVAQWVEYSNCAQNYEMSLDICKHAYILLCAHIVLNFWMRRKSNNPSQVPQRCQLIICNEAKLYIIAKGADPSGIQMSKTICNRNVKALYLEMFMISVVSMFCIAMLSLTNALIVIMMLFNLFSLMSIHCLKSILKILKNGCKLSLSVQSFEVNFNSSLVNDLLPPGYSGEMVGNYLNMPWTLTNTVVFFVSSVSPLLLPVFRLALLRVFYKQLKTFFCFLSQRPYGILPVQVIVVPAYMYHYVSKGHGINLVITLPDKNIYLQLFFVGSSEYVNIVTQWIQRIILTTLENGPVLILYPFNIVTINDRCIIDQRAFIQLSLIFTTYLPI